MGAFLPTPKTDKELDNGEKAGLKYALGAMQGWRVEMEDAHTVEIKDKLGKDTCLFAVFDGHAGSAVAKKASTDLLNHVVKDKEQTDFNSMSEKDLKDRLRDGFLKLDKKLKESNENSGSTALVCTITPQMIVFSNCGDSRGFLCRDGKVHFHTEDHKPYNDGERSRIEKAGGTVMMQRVNGQLAVSRALGDFYYKGVESLGQTEQMVSPEPETTIIERDDKDQFVVLACDGVFDVMTNEEVAEFISRKLTEEKNLEVICSQLIDICLNKVNWAKGWKVRL